ncbi:MAG TPA: efflux RND transporter periplasmic adaptor subunit [Clostridia bacterium]|nr:efflux RND transporter periplasmic adaptor subunit [Clostridia bacterium]
MINRALKIFQNTVLGFLILVFVMGFFSKSVINLFLPKVQVTSAVEMPVERTLVLEGTIEPGSIVKVKLGGEAVVDEYYAKSGDMVNIGDQLFRVNREYIGANNTSVEALELRLESEILRLEEYQNEGFKVDEADIEILTGKLNKSRAELLKYEELYKAGAIAETELSDLREDIFEQEMNLEKSRLELLSKKRENIMSVKEAEVRVKELQAELLEAKRQQQFYSKPDEEGICYSRVKGIVLNTNTSGVILSKEDTLAEISEVGGSRQLLFSAEALGTEYDFIKSVGEIEIRPDSGSSPGRVRITSLSRIVEDGGIAIKGEFVGGDTGEFLIGQELKGIISKRYTNRGFYTVPKASLIAFDGFGEGKSGAVYLLEEKEGILGKEYGAKQAEVKILAVGDEEVIVSGLESYENPKVVTNPSYKLNDGTKVFLWE